MRTHRATLAVSPDPFHRGSASALGAAPPQPASGETPASLSLAQAEALARLSERIEALDRRIAEGGATSLETAIAALDKALDDRVNTARRAPPPPRRAVPEGPALPRRGERPLFQEEMERAQAPRIVRRVPYRRAVPAANHLRDTVAPADSTSARPADDGALRRDLSAARDFANTVAAQAREARDPTEMRALAGSIALLSAHMDRLAEDQAIARPPARLVVPEAPRPDGARSAAPAPLPAAKAKTSEAAAESCIGLSAVRNLERQVVRLAEGVGTPRRDPALDTIEKSLADLVARVGSLQDVLQPLRPQAPDAASPAPEPETPAVPAALKTELEALKASQDASDRRIQATLSGMHTVLERLASRTAHDGEGDRRPQRGERRRSDVERLLAALRHVDSAQDDEAAFAPRAQRREPSSEDSGLAALDASLAAIKATFLANARRPRSRFADD